MRWFNSSDLLAFIYSLQIKRNLAIMFVVISLIFVLLPLFSLSLAFSVVFRAVVVHIARRFRPDLVKIFSGTGALMALESIYTRPKLSILLWMVCEGNVTLEKCRSQFQSQVLEKCDSEGNIIYSQLRWRWVQYLGYLFWKEDKDFNLKAHIRLYDYAQENLSLPVPCKEENLQCVTGDLIAHPFAKDRSPWELLIIPKYDGNHSGSNKEGTVLVLRIHHAMADGHSILKLLLKLFNAKATKVPQPCAPEFPSRNWQSLLILPLLLPYRLAETVLDSHDGKNCWHLVGKKLSRKYYAFFSDKVSVDQIKEIKNHYNVGYDVVLFALAIGATRRLMIEARQEVPKSIACFAPLPLPKHPGGLVIHV